MSIAVVLFTRNLRVHDNPALADACARADRVVPLFVADPRIALPEPRRRFLVGCLTDLRASLRGLGADLVVRQGDPATEAVRVARSVGASAVTVTADPGRYARRRAYALERACATERLALHVFAGTAVVEPGDLRPAGGGDHYRVFTPYWRAWSGRRWRTPEPVPRAIRLPDTVCGTDPVSVLGPAAPATTAFPGGETHGRRRLSRWTHHAADYPDTRDDLAADTTSRLSPYLHFGCLSPLEVALRHRDHPGYLRQLCWRDFHLQVLGAFPDLPVLAYRPGAVEKWRTDGDLLAAWQDGRTGIPVVDAGMRQLAARGWMHNRARLITAAYLTKHLGLDWREGMRWYARRLVDADVANNAGNWQWVAGTGNDTRPYRRFNPLRQAYRFDPTGAYVRRWVPELSTVDGPAVHEPWRLPRPPRGYPAPVDGSR